MLWNPIERINAKLSVCYSKDLKYKILIYKLKTKMHEAQLVDNATNTILNRSWKAKSEAIKSLKLWIENKINPIKKKSLQ